jgi:hypothetical protein
VWRMNSHVPTVMPRLPVLGAVACDEDGSDTATPEKGCEAK